MSPIAGVGATGLSKIALVCVGLFPACSWAVSEEKDDRPRQMDAAGVVLQVADELQKRGVELVVAHLPMRYGLYPSPETPYTTPIRGVHPHTRQARREDLRLRLHGVRTIDLHVILLQASTSDDIYKENRFHLQEDAAKDLGLRLARELRSQGVLWREDGPRNVVFVGD